MLFVTEKVPKFFITLKIFSLCSYTSKQLDRIFHFVRVCWSWKTITYIRAERTRALRQNISAQYIHTSRERNMTFQLIGRPWWGLPSKFVLGCDSLTTYNTGDGIISYVSEFLKLFIGNQMNWVLRPVCE